MSANAPWLALSVDWQDSPMFDEATHGERLAWVCLLCHAKSQGRGGRVRLRTKAFLNTYRISDRALSGMLERAQKCGALELDGEFVNLCNWGVYQQKTGSYRPPKPTMKCENISAPVLGMCDGDGSGGAGGKRLARPRDLVFEAVENLFYAGQVIPETRSQANAITTAFKRLGATPDDIAFAYRKHVELMPTIKVFSGFSVINNWARLKPKPKRAPALEHPKPVPIDPGASPEEMRAILHERRKLQ